MVTLKFDIYFKYEKVGRCEIENGVLIKNEVYVDPYRAIGVHPFPNSKHFMSVAEALADRVIPECRCDSALLSHMGLSEYNIYGILRYTHGVSCNDYIWFKYDEDPESLCYEDVKVKGR